MKIQFALLTIALGFSTSVFAHQEDVAEQQLNQAMANSANLDVNAASNMDAADFSEDEAAAEEQD